MKVRVTHLKAPWQQGTVVGDVLLLDVDTIPAWAAGKCVQVAQEHPAGDLVVNPEGAQDAKPQPTKGKGQKAS